MIFKLLEMVKEVLDQDKGKGKESSFIVLIFGILCAGIVLSFNVLNEAIQTNNEQILKKLENIETKVVNNSVYVEILKDRELRH
jgi:hypothetical protein